MKTKDFGFFQQHAEKLALGLGAAVILGVGATQFLMGPPNAIEVNNRAVAPGEIKDTVIRDYEALERYLNGESKIDEIVIPKYSESFRRLYERPVASNPTLAPFDVGGLAAQWLEVKTPNYPRKALPSPPVTTETLAKSAHGVLQASNDPRFTRLKSMIGTQEPADFPYVSVSASFSFQEWIQRLESPASPDSERIDPGLWRPRLMITSVGLLREEQDPATGQWSNATTIRPLPEQLAILPGDTTPREREEAQRMERWISENQSNFRRPAFPEISNGVWTPPDQSNRVFTSEELARQRELENDIRKLERQLARLTGNDQRGSDGRTRGRSSRNNDDDFDDFDEGFDDRGSRRETNDRETTRADRIREREEQRIKEMEDQLFEARTELNELLGVEEEVEQPGGGFDEFDEFNELDDFAPSRRPGFDNFDDERGMRGGEVPDTVKVWAHDLTAEPGKTYRYKVIVSVMNPLFQFPRLNEAQRQENFHRVSITHDETELEAANWSAPLTLDPKYYFFALSGSKDQKRANFEVWTVYNGLWRNDEFSENAGNAIGGETKLAENGTSFEMTVGAVLLDVDSIPSPTGRGASVVRVLYLDPESGQIDYRLVNDDKNSDARQRLVNEQRRQLEQVNARVSSNN